MNQTLRVFLFAIFSTVMMPVFTLANNDGLPRIYQDTYLDHLRKVKNKYGFISADGVPLTDPIFDTAYPFSSNGLALVCKEGYYGYINTKGEYFIDIGLEDARPFDEFGLAAIKLKSKWAIINSKKLYVVKGIFDKIEKFQSNGLAIVKYGSKFGLVDTLGNVVLPVIYDKIENFDNSGYAYIKSGEKIGIVDNRGRAVIAAEHRNKKSAMAALSDMKSKLAKPNLTLADIHAINKVAFGPDKSEQARKAEEERQLAEQARKAEEERQLAEQARKAEARKRLEEIPTLQNYILANLGDWNDYLAAKDLNLPSEEEIRNFIEAKVVQWQVKGEFEPTAKWKERVNEFTRTAKINFLADSILSVNSRAIEDVREEYRKKYEALADKYCTEIADQFTSQTLVINPYDADNETFLISTNDFGDFLLPVPLEEAPGFKQDWDKWKTNATASFVPNGEDVVLKTVKIGKYTYDSDMNASYAQVDIDYNFKPVDLLDLNQPLNAGMDFGMSFDNEDDGKRNKVSQTERVRISASTTPDIDINIPEGKSAGSQTFAVVIANGEYTHASKVSHAENDGRIMSQYLIRTLGIPENNVATYINATYGQIAAAVSMLQDIGDAYKGSDFNIMFYYVGHGLPDDDGKKSYILPVDMDPRQVSLCMPLEKIYADLGNLGAKNVTIMIDACFSGANHGEGMLIPQSMGVVLKSPKASPIGNMVVLAAAEGNETAFPYEEKKHGLFTYWLLKKLQETSGYVTFGELSDYVIDNVKKTSITVNRKRQTPNVATSPQLADSWRNILFGD